MKPKTRRQFIDLTMRGALAASAAGGLGESPLWAAETGQAIPRRPFGKTGVNVPALALGGARIGGRPAGSSLSPGTRSAEPARISRAARPRARARA